MRKTEKREKSTKNVTQFNNIGMGEKKEVISHLLSKTTLNIDNEDFFKTSACRPCGTAVERLQWQ